MKSEDKKKFFELLVLMGEVFQKEVTKPMMRILWTLLEKYEYESVEKGIYYLLETRRITGTLPVPAEIINAIQSGSGLLSVDDRAELAWNVLLWTIENVGHMKSVMFDDPIIHDVVQAMGGWLRICSADGDVANEEWHTKNLQWRRKDFIAMYRIMANQKPSIPYLVGEQQAVNSGVYDAFVPKIIRITGKPGSYLTIPHEKPKELPRPEDFDLVATITQKMVKNG